MAAGARLEWLPLEALAYSGCQAHNELKLDLAPGDLLPSPLAHRLAPLGLDRRNQLFLPLDSKAGHVAKLSTSCGSFERIDRRDPALLPDLLRGLETYARELHELVDARRQLRAEFFYKPLI